MKGAGATLGPLLLLVPCVASGVLRAMTGAPLTAGLVAGVAAAGVIGWLAFRDTASRRMGPWVASAAMAALALGVLYAVPFGGLVTVGGGDAGQHVRLAGAFATNFPGAYHGFAGFYALTQWLERLFGLNAFASFRAGFYCVPIAFALVASALHGGGKLGWAVSLGAYALLGWRVLFPLFHYHQADGYYAHLFGLVVLWATVAAYAFAESPWTRLWLWLPAAAFYRHTYGLNLGDFCVAAAALTALEAVQLRRWALLAVPAVALCAAGYAFFRLRELIGVQADTVYATHHQVLRGEAFLVLAALGAAVSARKLELPPVAARALTAAAAFGACNCLVQMGWRLAGMPNEYYFLKYHLHGVMLALLVVVAVLAPALARLVQRRAWVAAAALAVPLAIGVFNLDRGYGAYRAPFDERVSARPPFQHIGPLADLDGWAEIDRVLRTEKAAFGGLIAPSWPLMNFMNAAFEPPEGQTLTDPGWSQYIEGRLTEGPGRCVFWYASPRDFVAYATTPESEGRRAEVGRMLQAREGVCVEYPARWDPSQPQRLCHTCWPL